MCPRYEPVESPDDSTLFPYHSLTPPTTADIYNARTVIAEHLPETVDPVGTGDAVVGGQLARRLDGASVFDGLASDVATAAPKRTVEGDMPQISTEEVSSPVADGGSAATGR